MGVSIGYEGIVTSWAGTPFDVTKIGSQSARFSIDGEELDVTKFAANLEAMLYTPGLRSWRVDISGVFPASAALTGFGGLVSWGAGSEYDTNIREWNLDLNAQALDATVFDGSGVVWRTFVPGLYSWGGTYSGFIDDTTAVGTPLAPGGTLGTITLKSTEDGGTDRTLSGSAFIRQISGAIEVGNLNTAQFAYRGSSELTAAGTNHIFAAGALDKPAAGSLVFQAAADRTFTGSAFATSVRLATPVDGLIRVDASAQGTGAITLG